MGTSLCLIGLIGVLTNRKNIVVVLMSIEVMLVGVIMEMLMRSVLLDDLNGMIMSI